ncbi:MAG: hypothetical protein IKR92_03725 [Alphaproteobacteria bacterium]|nr:hypothetical protein [Alphaproteobacteria bacterium]
MDSSVALSEPTPATPVKPVRKHTPAYQQQEQAQTGAELSEVSALIAQLKELTMRDSAANALLEMPENIYKPIRGKSKFARRHHIYQTLDISPTVSTDKDPDQPDYTSNGKEVDEDQLDSPLALGLNFGYSLIFVPGREEDGQLRLNRMGFAYNVGLVASFSRQEKYGTTCNFLLKSGIETGNGHPMGIGFDVLGGYGKSAGDTYLLVYEEDDADDLATPYTEWCWQYGAQLWLRSNLLHTAVNNAEMLIFARFIRSVNPNGDELTSFVSDKIAYENYWKDESWSFGITFRYKF